MRQFIMGLLTCSLAMSVLIAGYMAMTPILAKRYAAKGRYYAWLIIVIGLLFPFRPYGGNTSAVRLNVFPARMALPLPMESGAANTPPATVISGISIWSVLGIVWLVGLIVFVLYQGVRHYRFIKMTARWAEPVPKEYYTLLDRLKQEMGISSKIAMLHCPSIGSPMLTGFIHPRIYLPDADTPEDRLQMILRHELIHYKRKDLWYKSAVLAASAIHWFNPVVYLMAKAIGESCETSCDAAIVQNMTQSQKRQYTNALIDVVRDQSKWKISLSTSFYGGKKAMVRRILSILDTKKKRLGGLLFVAVLLCVLLTGEISLAADNGPESLNDAPPPQPLIYLVEDCVNICILLDTDFPVIGIDIDWYVDGRLVGSQGHIRGDGTTIPNWEHQVFTAARQERFLPEETEAELVVTLTKPDLSLCETKPVPLHVTYGATQTMYIAGNEDSLVVTLE